MWYGFVDFFIDCDIIPTESYAARSLRLLFYACGQRSGDSFTKNGLISIFCIEHAQRKICRTGLPVAASMEKNLLGKGIGDYDGFVYNAFI